MALTLAQLQDYINTNIKKNGRNAVTGDVMNYAMLESLSYGSAAYQSFLVSGTNIKTLNGVSLLGSGDIVISSGLTIGTTTITSGTDGRLLFQSGGVVQQDSLLFWDNTNKRLGIGATPATTVRLDVRMQGSGSGDIGIRVRNSLNDLNIFQVNGNNTIYMLGDGDAGSIRLSKQTGHSTLLQQRSSNTLPSIFTIAAYAQGGSIGQIKFDTLFGDGTTPVLTMSRLISGVTDLTGTSLYGAFGTNATCFVMKNASGYLGIGTAPNAVADHFSMYSADIVAGNAAPHFRTENGDIQKIYSIGGWGTPTGTLTRTTFDESTVTLPQLAQRVAALITDLKTGHQLLKA